MTLARAEAGVRGIRHPWTGPPEPGRAVEVADGILWFRLPLPMALDHVNIYALDDGPSWTVIDTGLDWRGCRDGWQAVLEGPLAGKPVGRVILTHHHPDHVGLAGRFAAEGAEIRASSIAWLTARMLILDRQEAPTPEQVEFRRRAGVTGAALDAYRAERPFNFADCCAPLPLGFGALDEGDRIEAAGRSWTVRLGDGHAPRHVTLWSDDGLLLAGDQVLPGISPNIGVYPTEPDADPLAGWLETCRRFAALGLDPLVLPGHRLPFTGLAHRLDQLIDNHESALDRIITALAENPRTAVEVFPALFRREVGASEHGLALVEAVAHLNHLYRAGRAARSLDAEGAWRYRPA